MVCWADTKKRPEKVGGAVKYALQRVILAGSGILLVAVFALPYLASLLNVPESAFWVLVGSLLLALILPVFRGRLHGLHQFGKLSGNLVLEGASKVFVGVGLVLLGFGVDGALFGIFASFAVAIVFGFHRKSVQGKATKVRFFATTIPLLINTLLVAAAYSIDVFIVKIRADPVTAGYYAALSLFGKIIFFATLSMPQVVFAEAVKSHAERKPTYHVLAKPLLVVLGVVTFGTLGYVILGEFLVRVLLGAAYVGIGHFIAPLGIAMGALSASSLICMYDLALSRNHTTILLALAVVTQGVLLSLVTPTLSSFVWTLAALHVITTFTIWFVSFFSERLCRQ